MGFRARISSAFEKLGAWSIPAKLILGAGLGALGGAGVLSFLMEYATYNYALAYGFRPPVEGVPYLPTLVPVGSAFLLMSGAALSAVIVLMLQWFVRTTPSYAANGGRPLVWWVVILATVAVISIWSPHGCDSGVLACSPRIQDFAHSYGAAIGGWAIGTALSSILAAYPRTLWYFVLIYTSLYYAVVIKLMFTAYQYADFLRFAGFGGGLPVVVQLVATDTNQAREVKGHLMLRTTTVLVVYDSSLRRFEELPLDKVEMVSYEVGGLLKLPHRLPE